MQSRYNLTIFPHKTVLAKYFAAMGEVNHNSSLSDSQWLVNERGFNCINGGQILALTMAPSRTYPSNVPLSNLATLGMIVLIRGVGLILDLH